MKYPKFKLIIRTQNGEMIQTYHTVQKSRIASVLSGKKKIKTSILNEYVYEISVYYGKGYHNRGIYNKIKDAIFAYKCFSEKSLINDFI